MPTDEELMLAAGKGDMHAFEQIVLRHQTSAWNAAYGFLVDPGEAEDIAQEAFLKILDAAPRYQPTAAFRTYLCRVVTRLCLDHVRKKKPVYTDAPPAATDPSPAPPEIVTQHERAESIRNAIEKLPPRQRMAVVLRHFEGFTYRDIASAMNASEKSVERLLARARISLQALLADLLGE